MYLKRLEIQGFKTFAGRNVLEFRPGITAIVGPNGSGKCLEGSEKVTLADGREVPIRDLVDRALAAAPTAERLEDGWVTRENPDEIRVLSLNPYSFRLEPRPVAGFVKREAPPELLRIRTRSGREVTVTPYHPLFTLDTGELRALRADEVRVGVRVALARRLPVSSAPVAISQLALSRSGADQAGGSVPHSPLSINAPAQAALLAQLFAADAQIHSAVSGKSHPYVEFVTTSKEQADAVIGLLLRFGIFASLRVKRKRAANPTERNYYSVCIEGSTQLRQLAEHLEGAGAKAATLAELRQLPPADSPNDLVPGVAPLVRRAAQLAGVSDRHYRTGRGRLATYAEGRCEASRGGLGAVCAQIAELGTTPALAAPLLGRLRALASSDVCWDEVVAVEPLAPSEPWVYDLSVDETHNFVASNVIVHNSNLSDAVRWVLGEQSLATLRCKRAEELIYAGGGRRPPAGFAEVALTIDNSDRLLPLDFDEVTIARRVTRAGDNEYSINRAKVRLRDVLEAIEPLGGSYTIINQGLVDAALTLRPEERRRLFEDAAEIGGFELRKAEALRRLRETEANLQRLGDLLAELEPRLRSLKRQAGQARQHRELSAELHALQTRYYAMQWRAARALAGRTRAEVAALEAELERARATQQAISAELSALRAAIRARREAIGELHQQSAGLHRQAEAAQRDLAVGAERLTALTRRGEELERQRNELGARRAQADEQRQAAAAELARAEAELETTRAELRQAEAELAGMERARQALAQELRAAQEASVRAAAAVAEQQSRLEQLQAQRGRLQREAGELEAARAQADERLAAARAQVEAARAELAAAETARADAQAAEAAARAELDELRQARARAEEQRNAARRNLADLEARLDSLARLARSYAGAFAGVRAAMQWADRAGRPGFALVQSIIRTPAELETAVEVALGSRLQNIVVERWEDAEDAIAELKRSGAGRATFMPLDTIRGGTDKARGDQGEGGSRGRGARSDVLGVAADLVEYDEHYAPVVRQLLGRVLIVRDLATARAELRRLSGGWTIVTLAGEQVSSGGAVTGGAATKESGALRRERELRELPGQVAAARAELEANEARRAELEARGQQLAQTMRELEAKAREAGRQIESRRAGLDGANRRVAQAEQERAWAEQRRERLAQELAGLDTQEAELRARQEQATQAAAVAETHLNELRARQEQSAQSDRAAQERLATLRAAAGAAEGQLRAQRSLLAAHEASLSQIERQNGEIEQAVAGLAQEREKIAAEHERAEAAHAGLLAAIDALRAQIDPAETELRDEEARLGKVEGAEERATAELLEREAAHGRAALEAQRAEDRMEALFERAAADGIDVEQAVAEQGQADEPDPDGASSPSTLPALAEAIDTLKGKILRLGVINPLALEEYEETAERQRFLGEQADDLQRASTTLHELIAELDGAMSERFQRTFEAVAAEFERTFPALFGGGSAKLVLAGGESRNGQLPAGEALNGQQPPEGEAENGRPQTQGVEIIARPPGKKQQNISLLSGGERTLTAAALLFAILRVNPSPFCILDETDAALDESNVGRFREALERLTDQTQFILITHNRGTIEAADTLYGVSMGEDGASKLISLRVEEYVAADEA